MQNLQELYKMKEDPAVSEREFRSVKVRRGKMREDPSLVSEMQQYDQYLADPINYGSQGTLLNYPG
jgi:hypothetical protein